MKLYMEVTSDEYELPVAVAESPKELAEMTNVNSSAIRSAVCHMKMPGRKRSKYVRLEVEDEDE